MFGNEKAQSIRSFLNSTERQHAWDEFLDVYISYSKTLTEQEILDYIQSIQHYAMMDHYLDKKDDPEKLLTALNYMSCIAHTLAYNTFYEKDDDPKESLTKNLFLCIQALYPHNYSHGG